MLIKKMYYLKVVQHFEISIPTFRKYLNKFGIEFRYATRLSSSFTKEELIDLYVNQKLSVRDIAELAKLGRGSIEKDLKEHNIQLRDHANRVTKPRENKLSKELLIELYETQGLSTRKISKICEASTSSIGNWLREYKIERRRSDGGF